MAQVSTEIHPRRTAAYAYLLQRGPTSTMFYSSPALAINMPYAKLDPGLIAGVPGHRDRAGRRESDP